jgi:F0F1-type ATP synthase assembly protein I
VSWLNSLLGLVAPLLAALQGLDWRVVAIIGGVSVVLGIYAISRFRGVRSARMDMAKQGIV